MFHLAKLLTNKFLNAKHYLSIFVSFFTLCVTCSFLFVQNNVIVFQLIFAIESFFHVQNCFWFLRNCSKFNGFHKMCKILRFECNLQMIVFFIEMIVNIVLPYEDENNFQLRISLGTFAYRFYSLFNLFADISQFNLLWYFSWMKSCRKHWDFSNMYDLIFLIQFLFMLA